MVMHVWLLITLRLQVSLVFDVDESALVGGQSMDIYPGKVFRRQAGMPGQAIHGMLSSRTHLTKT